MTPIYKIPGGELHGSMVMVSSVYTSYARGGMPFVSGGPRHSAGISVCPQKHVRKQRGKSSHTPIT